MRRCRICGCTEEHACYDALFQETCSWVELDLCSFCAESLERARERDEPLVRIFSDTDANRYLRQARG